MIDQDDLSARLHNARAFGEHAFGILDQRDHELGDRAVETGARAIIGSDRSMPVISVVVS
jgi:hypothetical protein